MEICWYLTPHASTHSSDIILLQMQCQTLQKRPMYHEAPYAPFYRGVSLSIAPENQPPHFLPLRPMLPLLDAAGPPLSTRTESSSLLVLIRVLAGVVVDGVSNPFMSSDCMDARRFSHHAFSVSVCAWISPSRVRKATFAAISLADWKIV